MREQILELKAQGKKNIEIAKELGLHKSTITYHVREDSRERHIKSQKNNENRFLMKRIDKFKNKRLADKTRDFQRRIVNAPSYPLLATSEKNFGYRDVIDKFGMTTECYLSGVTIDLIKDTEYNLDHIMPPGKGGDNTLDNLGITHKVANMMKQDLTKEELLGWCERILRYNGYVVTKEG